MCIFIYKKNNYWFWFVLIIFVSRYKLGGGYLPKKYNMHGHNWSTCIYRTKLIYLDRYTPQIPTDPCRPFVHIPVFCVWSTCEQLCVKIHTVSQLIHVFSKIHDPACGKPIYLSIFLILILLVNNHSIFNDYLILKERLTK